MKLLSKHIKDKQFTNTIKGTLYFLPTYVLALERIDQLNSRKDLNEEKLLIESSNLKKNNICFAQEISFMICLLFTIEL